MKGPAAFKLCIVGKVRLEEDGNITHLQKYSPLGYLITWPFCFHVWFFWRKQAYAYDQIPLMGKMVDVPGTGHWIPGTEQGIYFRTPGWRYDVELGMIWTNGYVGGHWD